MSDVWPGPPRPRISLFGSKWRFYLVLAVAAVVPLVIFLAASHWLLRRIAINNLLGQSQRSGSTVELVLTDVIMPGMSGGELIARLRSIKPGLAVLFMSGYASDLIAHAGIAEPEKLLIQKPFTKKTLLAKVRSVLDESGRDQR